MIEPYPFLKIKGDTFYFKPTNPRTQLGTFKIKAELSDGYESTPFDFFVTIFNEPPYFLTPPTDQVVYLGSS